jgi:hypothetical protein
MKYNLIPSILLLLAIVASAFSIHTPAQASNTTPWTMNDVHTVTWGANSYTANNGCPNIQGNFLGTPVAGGYWDGTAASVPVGFLNAPWQYCYYDYISSTGTETWGWVHFDDGPSTGTNYHYPGTFVFDQYCGESAQPGPHDVCRNVQFYVFMTDMTMTPPANTPVNVGDTITLAWNGGIHSDSCNQLQYSYSGGDTSHLIPMGAQDGAVNGSLPFVIPASPNGNPNLHFSMACVNTYASANSSFGTGVITQNPTASCSPATNSASPNQNVAFTAQENGITNPQYSWVSNGGTPASAGPSGIQTTAFSYSAPGNYSPTLSVSGSNIGSPISASCQPVNVVGTPSSCSQTPTPVLSAIPSRVIASNQFTLNWSASGITAGTTCTITGPNLAGGAIVTVPADSSCNIAAASTTASVATQAVYTMSCGAGPSQKTTVVNVVPKFKEL